MSVVLGLVQHARNYLTYSIFSKHESTQISVHCRNGANAERSRVDQVNKDNVDLLMQWELGSANDEVSASLHATTHMPRPTPNHCYKPQLANHIPQTAHRPHKAHSLYPVHSSSPTTYKPLTLLFLFTTAQFPGVLIALCFV